MKVKVFKDKQGNIVNIGDWNYDIKTDIAKDKDGNEIEVEIVRNPLPDGYVEVMADVIETDDGKFVKDSKQHLLFQIKMLENKITPRRRDEAILGDDNGWLKAQRDKITELRAKL